MYIMKRLLSTILLFVAAVTCFSQSYDQLWKNVSAAERKDLPKTEITALGKIVSKATKENNYGQLLAAGLKRGSVQLSISPDSLKAEVKRLEREAETAHSTALKAVFYAVLGDIYRSNASLGDDHVAKGADYWRKAMSDPAALAAATAKGYEPFVGNGVDSKIFNDDLLHVIGKLTGDYATLNKYYDAHGNRAAACMSALSMLASSTAGDVDKIAALDSLITVYGDVAECAELAMRRYGLMPQGTNDEAKAKYEYGEQVLRHWSSWKNIATVANGQKQLTQPKIEYTVGKGLAIPGKEQTVRFSARNVSAVTLTATRLNVNGDTDLNPTSDNDLKKLKAARIMSTKTVVGKNVSAANAYETTADSLVIPGLSVGVWLLEMSTPDSGVSPSYGLLYVSDVALIIESLPDNKTRYVVVNATTGKPVAGARLRITQHRAYGQSDIVNTLTTDSDGEAAFTSAERYSTDVWAYTDTDKASPSTYRWAEYFGKAAKSANVLTAFTDRSVYRPGQVVHASLIAYTQDNATRTRKATENSSVTLTLRDANYKEVEKQIVTTDRFGSASADFTLPSSGLTGNFTISAQAGNCNGSASFDVDEYKRPTFEVALDDYTAEYKAGDTITVTGSAHSYAGVPVQGAKVEYTVSRRSAWWWRWWGDDADGGDFSFTGTAITDDDGAFKARVPLVLPSADARALSLGRHIYHYYNVELTAKVTDQGGESHEGSLSLPLGTRPTALACDIPDKVLRDSLRTVTFKRVNMAGKEIPGTVSWTISPRGRKGTSPCNKPVTIGTLSSGSYTLVAACGGDTLKKDFTVFSVADKRPVVTTHDWFWQSAGQFPADGKPVYVQFGSSDDDQHVVYTLISGGNKILEQGSLNQSNALTTRKFTYRDDYGDGLVLNVAWVRDGVVYRHRAEIRRPEKDNRLRMSWRTFRDNLVPGQKEEWTLTVLNPDGKPADAQLMATLYDKSLDQIVKHDWAFNPQYSLYLPTAMWNAMPVGTISGTLSASLRLATTTGLAFRSINTAYYRGFKFPRYGLFATDRLQPLMAASVGAASMKLESRANVETANGVADTGADGSASDEAAVAPSEDGADKGASDRTAPAQLREILDESAFFYPQLATGKDGTVQLKFTLPESVTTWRFMGLAHDADINFGLLTAEAVAKKAVMIQPNMPRFVRIGDKARLASRIFNTSDKAVSGTARLEILDPSTDVILYNVESPFRVDSGKTATATFDIAPSSFVRDIAAQSLLVVRVTASGDGFSDGEQHYLAVLPDREFVTNTRPFTLTGSGTTDIPLESIVHSGVSGVKVKFEMTANPAWLMVQSLPYVANPSDKNAISLATALFANGVASHIVGLNPKIKTVFEQWRRESGTETSLASSLEKDEELKTLVLSETPWVADAAGESAQKRALANYFDTNTLEACRSQVISGLKNLQNPDGSFSWWQGMDGSAYMTVAVVKTLVRLEAMTGESVAPSLLDKAWAYLDSEAAREVSEMKRAERRKVKVYPSDALCDYVYANALAKRPTTADINYIVGLVAKMPRDLTIYGKANCAVILAMYGHPKTAREYLQSIGEYSVYKEDMGRYFDTPKAAYSWFDYKIPTQTAAIEAYRLLQPSDRTAITEMQHWLLQEKRTQAWDTPLNSANAIYAFLGGDTATSRLADLDATVLPAVSLGGNAITLPQPTAGTGYVKADISSQVANTAAASSGGGAPTASLRVSKPTDGVSWGAVYAQFFQKAVDIKGLESGMTVSREVLGADGKPVSDQTALKVGDNVRVRITITADRDYDFVEVVDRRAACLEPANQLSGYRWGCYVTPRDCSTNYYFDRLSKGTHVVETEYYVDRSGDYISGTCVAQCAYAPEFMGRAAVETLSIGE